MSVTMISIEDTELMPFGRNFAGKPDDYGDDRRKCFIKIKDPRQANELMEMGVRVKQTKPRPDEDPDDYIPTYYTQCILKYRDVRGNEMKYPPKIYLVNLDGVPVPLDEESVHVLDKVRISNVNVILNPWESKDGHVSLYIRTLYIEQDFNDDPFASRYARRQ